MRDSNKIEKMEDKWCSSDKLKRPGTPPRCLTLTETGGPGLLGSVRFSPKGWRPHEHPSAPRGPFLHQLYFLKKREQQKTGTNHYGQWGRGDQGTVCPGNRDRAGCFKCLREPQRYWTFCRAPCKVALEVVHSFNMRSYHIPFDDIIPLQSWFSRAGVIKTQVLCKY